MDSQDTDSPRALISAEAEKQGLTLKELSLGLGRNHAYLQQYIDRGVPAELKEKDRRWLAKRLNVPESKLGGEQDQAERPSVRTSSISIPSPRDMEQNVPVLGNAAGGTRADFLFNGETIDFVRRPPGVALQQGIFALHVVGESMSPKFEDGELIFASSARTASIGDYVIIELLPQAEAEPSAGYIKRLVRRTATKVVCEQYNPKKLIEFETRRVKAVHRVLPMSELIGV